MLKVLQQLGVVETASPPRVAGISAGAIAASAICSGVPAESLHHTVTSLLHTCRVKPCAGRMDKILKELLEVSLPPDAPQRCKGRFFAGVTVLQNHVPTSVITSVIDGINNRADMIATLAASAYIPMWSGNNLFTTWRGMQTADGSFSAQQPCPPGVTYCIRVSSRSADIETPTLSDTLAAIGRALVGAKPAAARIKKPRLPDKPPAAAAQRQRKLWERGVDIAPGLSVPSAFDTPAWTEVRLLPPPPHRVLLCVHLCFARSPPLPSPSGPRALLSTRRTHLTAPLPFLSTPPHPLTHPLYTVSSSSASSRATPRRAITSTASASSTRWRGPRRPASRRRR